MQRQSSTKNIIAGTFLIGTLIIGVLLAFVFSGYSFERTNRYMVQFPLDVGAAGIQPGSMVTLGGRSIGQVASLQFDSTRADGAPDQILVEIDVLADLVLYSNARAFLEQPLLGTISTINLVSPGDPDQGVRLVKNGMLKGRLAPPGFLAQAGFGPDQQEQVTSILTQFEQGSTRLNNLLEPFESRSEYLANLAEGSLTNLSDASYNLRIRLDEWSNAVDNVVADVEWFSGELRPMVLSARDGVDEASLLFKRSNGFLDDNTESIEASIASIERALADIENGMIPEYTRLAKDARERVADLDGTLEEADRFMRAELVPNLRRTLANASVASGFLKHAIAEVRDQPWRLLVRPTKKELAEQLIYDAARTYAGAVGDLRSASEAMAISLRSDLSDPEQISAMAGHLDAAFDKYELAERDLLERMTRIGE